MGEYNEIWGEGKGAARSSSWTSARYDPTPTGRVTAALPFRRSRICRSRFSIARVEDAR
jgi:hypothetical protein